MRLDKLEETVEVPEGAQVEIVGTVIKVKGPKGDIERNFRSPKISFESKDSSVVFISLKPTKREKKLMLTFVAHLKNMLKGVLTPHKYQMKICSGHFPMSVAVSNGQLTVKNFLGEKTPRVLKLKEGADVKLDGELIMIESADIEIAGQIATGMEQLTRITNRDIRVFQDGIYIVKKPRDLSD
jgi:large subunit ribosomal protein L6